MPLTKTLQDKAQNHPTTIRENPELHSLAYASRLAAKPIPKHKLPEKMNDPYTVKQLISDELALDGKGVQNMATFLSTWMEPAAEELIRENLYKNLADKDEYPQMLEIQDRCIHMLADLYNAPKESQPTGTSCAGSSEALMISCLSHKFMWRKKLKEQGKDTSKPNMVFGNNAQVVIEKFCRYFDVEPRMVPVSPESRHVLDPKKAIDHIDENTICVVVILGSTYTGQMENVEEMSNLLDKLHKEKGLDVPIHVDAASGGFIAPFVYPNLKWDFRLPRVHSINVSGHKYGLVYPGVGWAIWREKEYLPEELIFHLSYLGGDNATFNLNFSMSSFQTIAQYYNFLRLGREGYTSIMQNCMNQARFLSKHLLKSELFTLYSDLLVEGAAVLPVVSFALKDKDCGFDEYDVMRGLKQYGWIVPAYALPPDEKKTVILRCVVREQHSEDIIAHLFDHIMKVMEFLKEHNGKNGAVTKRERGEGKHHTFNSVC